MTPGCDPYIASCVDTNAGFVEYMLCVVKGPACAYMFGIDRERDCWYMFCMVGARECEYMFCVERILGCIARKLCCDRFGGC